MKILCLSPYPEEGPSVRHRIWGYKDLWENSEIHLTLWSFMSPNFYKIRRKFDFLSTIKKPIYFLYSCFLLFFRLFFIKNFDAVIIHREVFPLGSPFIETLICRLNKHTYFDLDDATWFPPSQDINQRRLFWDPQRVAKIMRACHTVVAGSSFIQQYALNHTQSVIQIPTSYDSLIADNSTVQKKSPDRLKIIWIGNTGNAEYLFQVIPVLEKLSDKYSFTLQLVGGEDIQSIRSNKIEIDYQTWQRGLEKTWLLEADIGLMPLYNRPYEQGKCSFKLIQYFSAGLPVIASPVGMNKEVITEDINGYFASSESDWLNALQSLLNDANIRENMGRNGLETYKSLYTREKNSEKWVQLFLH